MSSVEARDICWREFIPTTWELHQTFLTDKSRNYFNDDHLYVSSIFDWYREDSENVLGVDSVCQVLESYKEQLGVRLDSKFCLQTDDIKLDYLDHDWSLNRVFFDWYGP